MSENEKYNGWANKPTWIVALWAYNNDEGTAEYHDEMGYNVLNDNDGDKEAASWQLAKRLEDEYDEGNPLSDTTGVYNELLSWALAVVNWTEVAEHIIDGVYNDWKADNPDDEEEDTLYCQVCHTSFEPTTKLYHTENVCPECCIATGNCPTCQGSGRIWDGGYGFSRCEECNMTGWVISNDDED